MPTFVFNALNSGYIYSTAAGYAATHNAANGNSVWNGVDFWGALRFWVSQDLMGWFIIDRGGLAFDTSTIPVGATIVSGEVDLYADNKPGAGNSTVYLVSGALLAEPLVVADFGDLLGAIIYFSSGIRSWMDFNPGNWCPSMVLNANGLAAIVPGGITRFGLRSDTDVNSNIPTAVGRLGFASHLTGNIPRLTVVANYPPTVQTDPATGVT